MSKTKKRFLSFVKTFKSWFLDVWRLDRFFVGFAMIVGVIAAAILALWVLVTFVEPFLYYSRYYPSETSNIPLGNGQALQIKYPNKIRSDDSAADVILILSGKSKATEPVKFTVEAPPNLTVIDPAGQSQSRAFELKATTLGNSAEPELIRIAVVSHWSADQSVLIKSMFLKEPISLKISSESFFWSSIRGIVNNTVSDKSALVLLVAGFLSGAGTLVMSRINTLEDRIREDREKRENRFRDQLDKNPVDTLNGFSKLDRDDAVGSDFSIKKELVEAFGWEGKLQQIILEYLKSRDHYFDAKRAAEVLEAVCVVFDPKVEAENYRHSRSLAPFCKLICEDDLKEHELKDEEAQCLLDAYARWHELKPLVTDNMLHDFIFLKKNHRIIWEKFGREKYLHLLRDANIQPAIEILINELKNHEDDESKAALDAAEKINDLLIPALHWREQGQGKERKLSDKVLRWLFACFSELVDSEFSLGSEYAELEDRSKQSVMEFPVFGRINNHESVIAFGGEGMGKTASALWLMDQYTKATKANVFPVYAPYEAGAVLKDWIVGTITRALINFTADNPRKFITSPDSQKTALGRLFLWHARNLETLRFNLYSSSLNHSTLDVEQVIDCIKGFKPLKTPAKMTKDEMLNSLYLAYPAGFEQICFLWDIPASSPQQDVVNQIKEMAGLAVSLSRQNVSVKIFAPLMAKETVGDLAGIRHVGDLIWDDEQLTQLLNRKMKDKFENLWEGSLRDTVGEMLVREAKSSPRRLVRLLLHLMDYMDGRQIQSGETLTKSDFDQAIVGLDGKK